MSNVWFTADLHLGHGTFIKLWQRPFLAPDEMESARRDPRGQWRVSEETVGRHDDAIVEAINSRVGADAVLWILGDFCKGRLEQATRYRDRIQCCQVHLVWGNHDHRSIRPLFIDAIEQGMIHVEGQDVWLNHYPMRRWERSFYGSWHLYGHVHGRFAAEDAANGWMLTKDVGIDACGYRPLCFDELRAYMAPRIEKHRECRSAALRGGASPLA
jgi:calcineurin-like phosphoesterase family protein